MFQGLTSITHAGLLFFIKKYLNFFFYIYLKRIIIYQFGQFKHTVIIRFNRIIFHFLK